MAESNKEKKPFTISSRKNVRELIEILFENANLIISKEEFNKEQIAHIEVEYVLMARQRTIDDIARNLLKRIAIKEKEERQTPVLDEDMDVDIGAPNQIPSNQPSFD
ncbi:hypothetical protein COLO4_35456 [Corchorus olitorius]|uniref:Uncharacterized protein n=1 Tax=Corchorus olitorius TaxID=93759 RepID=A0A1R3GGU4_9ROSI|nr:hypothetical protein COLO4_35456 [Corchorus olitorius]